jgi:hypothetical protein
LQGPYRRGNQLSLYCREISSLCMKKESDSIGNIPDFVLDPWRHKKLLTPPFNQKAGCYSIKI